MLNYGITESSLNEINVQVSMTKMSLQVRKHCLWFGLEKYELKTCYTWRNSSLAFNIDMWRGLVRCSAVHQPYDHTCSWDLWWWERISYWFFIWRFDHAFVISCVNVSLQIIVPNTSCENGNMSKLFKLISDHYQNINISTVQRKYFNESKGKF